MMIDKKKSQEFALKRFYEVTEVHGERLVSGSDDFTLFLWNPEKDKKPLARLTGNKLFIKLFLLHFLIIFQGTSNL